MIRIKYLDCNGSPRDVETEIKVQLALGTFKIVYLTVETIKNITDIDLIKLLYDKVPGVYSTKGTLSILYGAIVDRKRNLLSQQLNKGEVKWPKNVLK